jgi:hypothetical protein
MVEPFKPIHALEVVVAEQKKTPRVARPKGFLRANPYGSTHRHRSEKLLEDYHRDTIVNNDFNK